MAFDFFGSESDLGFDSAAGSYGGSRVETPISITLRSNKPKDSANLSKETEYDKTLDRENSFTSSLRNLLATERGSKAPTRIDLPSAKYSIADNYSFSTELRESISSEFSFNNDDDDSVDGTDGQAIRKELGLNQ